MDGPKQRGGCLTAWLILIILANALGAVVNLAMGQQLHKLLPTIPDWMPPVLVALSVLDVIFAIALFAWKKWAFYGFCASALAAMAMNLAAGVGVVQSLLGLIGIAILYGLLQSGSPTAWSQME